MAGAGFCTATLPRRFPIVAGFFWCITQREAWEKAVAEFVRQGRDVLAGAYRPQMRRRRDFGFDVADTPRSKKVVEARKAA